MRGWVAAAAAVCAAEAANMNGKYRVASRDKMDVPFNDDYASKGHEYFDLYAPEIATHYGEVFWTSQGTHPLPDAIVKRFAGKVMAITGYEQDQVMVTPTGKPGENPDADVSVPINWAYNHHYGFNLMGQHSEAREVPAGPDDPESHGLPTKWIAVDRPSAALRADASVPTSQAFSEGNGGESRKSFHGYPDGYAQLLDSPDSWRMTPMQIDTRNRDCGATPADVHNCTPASQTGHTHFIPGPEPRSARYGRGAPADTKYSGILECPCNGRFGGDPMWYPDSQTKIVEHMYTAIAAGTCKTAQGMSGAAECFAAAPELGVAGSVSNKTVSDPKLPHGCSVAVDGGATTVYFNTGGKAECGGGAKVTSGSAANDLGVALKLQLDAGTAGGVVTITASGPADVWFGVGFDANAMLDQPYTLVVNSSGVAERKIGTCDDGRAHHCPGTPLAPSVTVVSNTVAGGTRTVVVTRPFQGASKDHYTFDPARASINLITAVGTSPAFAIHKAHLPASILLTGAGAASCVCDTGVKGNLCNTGGTGCTSFVKSCVAEPNGDLLGQLNPTCNSRQYAGGLRCCGHKRIMLDADQEVRPELLRYHMKIRIWFQELTTNTTTGAKSHFDLPRIYYQTEAHATEYDIPPAFALAGNPIVGYPNWPLGTPTPGTTCTGTCPDGPDCECVHTITAKWTVSNMRLIYAGGHCHAPACISIELFRADTGELLCRQNPVYGKGDVSADKYDEEGYLALPPCLWGNDKGLTPSELLPKNTPLVSIKRNRNTHAGHYGEMASWQMRGVFF